MIFFCKKFIYFSLNGLEYTSTWLEKPLGPQYFLEAQNKTSSVGLGAQRSYLFENHMRLQNPALTIISNTAQLTRSSLSTSEREPKRKKDGVQHRDDGLGLLCRQIWDLGLDKFHSASQSIQSGGGFSLFTDFLWTQTSLIYAFEIQVIFLFLFCCRPPPALSSAS